MFLHPKDTQEVIRLADKQPIAHLAYHMHYCLKHTWNEQKTRYEILKKIETIPVNRDLQKIANDVARQREQAFVHWAQTGYVKKLKAHPIGKIVHGLGAGHVRETSLTIHPVYGVPYIPASSVKGVIRHWFIEAYCDGKEENLSSHEAGALVFGTQERRGVVQFHDIFLTNGLQLVPDVLTVHMKKYYEKKQAATDDQSPTPVTFFTVTVSDVDIYITCDYAISLTTEQTKRLLDQAASWTISALTELGIGSKTSSGYGYFTNIQDVTESEFLPLVKREKEREAKRLFEEREKEQERQKQEEEARLAQLSPEERLVKQIEMLTNSQQDQEKSKSELYQEVIAQQNKQAAQALQAYWQRIGQWNVKPSKQKQYEKVQAIRALLEN
jgi:CRISPR-associated protein Cmr6